MNLRIFMQKELWIKKFSDNMKDPEVLEEGFVKCDNCGKNFETTQGLKDHFDQAHYNLQKSHKYRCNKWDYQKHQ